MKSYRIRFIAVIFLVLLALEARVAGQSMLTGDNLEKTAKALLGLPYILEGISIKGLDCSGFVKTVYRLNGMELHRDADQQADQGIPIDAGKNFENLQKGDLLFFSSQTKKKQSKRITHVGLSIRKGIIYS